MIRSAYFSIILFFASALTMAIATACSERHSDTEEPQGIETPVKVTITRAGYTEPDQNAEKTELITSYWVVFVNRSTGIITDIIDRPLENTDSVQTETFTTKLPSGRYDIYAFANMWKDIHSFYNYKFVKGEKLPDGVRQAMYREPPTDSGSIVPMSGFVENVAVSVLESNNIAVEVVRLVAKLNFLFYSDASRDITVDSIAVLSARTSIVPLFPNYDKLNDHTGIPFIPEEAVRGTYTYFWPSAPVVPKNTAKENAVTRHFYVFESTAEEYHPTEYYVLKFYVKDEKYKTHQLEALLYDLKYIYRNDLINIPVRFTDWNIHLDIRCYPPIGGYPTVVTTSKGDEFYAKFGSSGLFVIKPMLSDYSGKVYGYNEYTCDVSVESDDDNIITNLAAGLDNASEITGEIAIGKTGTAVLNLIFKVKEDKLEHQFIRKLHIIHEKNEDNEENEDS